MNFGRTDTSVMGRPLRARAAIASNNQRPAAGKEVAR
jgi:hypothetical protein